jgi:hypothetical protein
MEKQTVRVLDEIRQLVTQYRQEVPGRRRAWPESIKARIAQLCVLGMSAKDIADHTELSYYTILGWVPETHRRRYRTRQVKTPLAEGHFSAVAIRDATVTVAKSSHCLTSPLTINATVTVTLPDGTRIEGVTAEFLKSWHGRVGGA